MFQLRTLLTILQACKPSSTISIPYGTNDKLRDLVGQYTKKEEEKESRRARAKKSILDDSHFNGIDELIKSSVEDLVPIPSESEGIPDKMCDVPLYENTTPLNALNEHSEIIVNSDDDNSSSDDDSPYGEDIDYVDASPPDVEIVSLEVVEIVDPEVGRIDDDILLTIKDNTLREKLLNVNLLIAKIDALRDNPTHLEVDFPDCEDSRARSIHKSFTSSASFWESNYPLWEVIENGVTLPKTAIVEGVEILKFNSIKDAKLLLEAVEKRFGGNAATKKTQRNLLKKQYENFTTPSSEMLDQTFDRL
ncbi:hypothetical protein Tco_0850907 [Tanacetum coccineum]